VLEDKKNTVETARGRARRVALYHLEPSFSSSVAHAVTAPKAEEEKNTKKRDGTKKEKKGEPESEMLRR
jgi:hypothetical protein